MLSRAGRTDLEWCRIAAVFQNKNKRQIGLIVRRGREFCLWFTGVPSLLTQNEIPEYLRASPQIDSAYLHEAKKESRPRTHAKADGVRQSTQRSPDFAAESSRAQEAG